MFPSGPTRHTHWLLKFWVRNRSPAGPTVRPRRCPSRACVAGTGAASNCHTCPAPPANGCSSRAALPPDAAGAVVGDVEAAVRPERQAGRTIQRRQRRPGRRGDEAVGLHPAHAVLAGVGDVDAAVGSDGQAARLVQVGLDGRLVVVVLVRHAGAAGHSRDDRRKLRRLAPPAVAEVQHPADRVVSVVDAEGPAAERLGAGVPTAHHHPLLTPQHALLRRRRSSVVDVTDPHHRRTLPRHGPAVYIEAVPGIGGFLAGAWLEGRLGCAGPRPALPGRFASGRAGPRGRRA